MKESITAPDRLNGEVIDRATGTLSPTPRRIDLSTLRDVRLELAAVYRQMDAGNIGTQDGTRRAYILKTIHDVIVSAELERRIVELEEQRAGAIPGRRTLQHHPVN